MSRTRSEASSILLSRSRPAPRRGFRRLRPFASVTVLMLVASAYIPGTPANAQPLPSLRVEAEKTGVLIGSGAIRGLVELEDPKFAQVLAEQFNSLSPDNELKFSWIEPQQGVFNFAPIDTLVDFAEQHDMVVKGHGLISGCCNPGWLTNLPDPNQVRAATFNH